MHINCQLIKPAKLYLPHHIDVSNMEDTINHLHLLTAEDESFRNDIFTFKQNHDYQVTIESTLVKVVSIHFCSNCIGIERGKHSLIPKQYLIIRADKVYDNGHTLSVGYIFIYLQKKCKEVSKN